MKRNTNTLIIGLILIICVIFPMLTQGIMCNDEVQLRLSAQMGMGYFFKNYIVTECINKGRILGAIGNLKFLGYLFNNKYLFRGIELCFLLIGIGLFGYIVYRFFHNVKFSIFTCTIILIFLPITFEHAIPNAFIIVIMQPLILLELSIIFYIDYLEEKSKHAMIGCLFFFMWAMFLYEFVIVYILLFPMIYFIENIKNIKIDELIKKHLPLVACVIIYLILYFGQRYVFPTSYGGNEFGKLSFEAMIPVIKTLFLSAMPGYYCFANSKYKYLFSLYNNGKSEIENFMNPTIWIFVVALVYILIKMFHNKKIENVNFTQRILIYFSAIIFAVIPALPNSISKMYQGNVSDEFFTSLPVSIYIYISVMFGIAFFVWNIVLKRAQKYIWLLICAIILVNAVEIQIHNNIFANQESYDYDRFVAIEDLFDLSFWENYQGKDISAPTLYETRNTLAIEDGHWTQYLKKNDVSIDIQNNFDNKNTWIVQQKDYSFLIVFDENILYVSSNANEGIIPAKDLEENWNYYQVQECIGEEHNQFIYQLKLK